MTKLTTIKQFDELVAERVSEVFKSGDKDKIEKCMMLASEAMSYVCNTYPSMGAIISDYNAWKAMSRDVNHQSLDMLGMLFNKDELQQFIGVLDNEEALHSHWKEIKAEMEGLDVDAGLKNNQEILQNIADSL